MATSVWNPAAFAVFLLAGWASTAPAWDWFPSDAEMQKLRHSWNPQTHGSLLISPADLQPKGRWLLWGFTYGQVASGRFGSSLSTTGSGTPFHQDVIAPGAVLFYGLTDHISIGVSGAVISWNSDRLTGNQAGGRTHATGLDDIGLIVKTRFVVQDPDSWRPSIGTYTRISLVQLAIVQRGLGLDGRADWRYVPATLVW